MKKTLIALTLLSVSSFGASAGEWDKQSQTAEFKTTVDAICGVQVDTHKSDLLVGGQYDATTKFLVLNNKTATTDLKFTVSTDLMKNEGNGKANALDLIDVTMTGDFSGQQAKTLKDLNNTHITFDRSSMNTKKSNGKQNEVRFDLTLSAQHEDLIADSNAKTTITANVFCN